jgi:hypothetical protein
MKVKNMIPIRQKPSFFDIAHTRTDNYHVFCKPSKVILNYNVMVCSLCAN